jgi:tetratricopeptide (TPR) repeat protein
MKIFYTFSITLNYLLLAGCSLAQLDMEENPFAEQAPAEIEKIELGDDADYAKNNHGIVNIHRHGPGYDVMMMLNAGESDIIFSMDLPPGGSTDFVSAEDFLNGNQNSKTGMDQAGGSGDPAEEKNFFNKQALGLFSIATKHMLSAQALFYRKSYWKALEETNKAMSLVPASAQAHALKGSIYYKMGRKKDAKISWNNALKLDPSLQDVKESLKLVR